jgi:hypothetical protein
MLYNCSMTAPKNQINTLEAIAVAIAVFKQNGNRVVKFEKGVPGNKELILDHFANGSTLTVDLEQADVIKKTVMHRITMCSITGKYMSDFLIKTGDLIKEELVHVKLAAYIAWLPKLAADIKVEDALSEEYAKHASNSKHFGAVHGPVVLEYNELHCRHLKNVNAWRQTGHDGRGNIFVFWTKKKIQNGSTIKAKVKRHSRDPSHYNANTTLINYVKEIK